MKNVFYILLFSILFLSCKNTDSRAPVKEKETVSTTKDNSDYNSVYTEVSDLTKKSDYNLNHSIQKLDIMYLPLSFKIRYISDRAYISIENKNRTSVDWQPFKINFYYDMDFARAEKDIHLLLKSKDAAEGYLLFPAFTEQYAAYFVYYFKKNTLDYLGNYQATDFGKGPFSFDEQSKELYRTASGKVSKLIRIDKENAEAKREDADNAKHEDEDLKLLKEE